MRNVYELDGSGKFVGDFILLTDDDALPLNWTDTPFPIPCLTPRFVGTRNVDTGEWAGSWVDDGAQPCPAEHQALRERIWRNAELGWADIQINKLEDVGGNTQVWRDYRIALRNWPEHVHFPNPAYRPEAPQ